VDSGTRNRVLHGRFLGDLYTRAATTPRPSPGPPLVPPCRTMADAGRRKVIYYVRHGQSTTNAALDAAMKANGKLPGDSPFHRSSRDVMCEQTAPPVRACRAAKFTHRR
jgi:hypothetical protein